MDTTGSVGALEQALERMTGALQVAKRREEQAAARRRARAETETALRKDCDDCRQQAARLWAESQRLMKMLQAESSPTSSPKPRKDPWLQQVGAQPKDTF
ncbi:VIP2 [Symbiodinium natans]|uniref:VIP2 protein n=1 Tax=Symbiodinium natans TaxID=878477 RepID=A0A812H159_9DINO|nr:VIP2 [Symbiodinium natans]